MRANSGIIQVFDGVLEEEYDEQNARRSGKMVVREDGRVNEIAEDSHMMVENAVENKQEREKSLDES